jgi:hypothetical protein
MTIFRYVPYNNAALSEYVHPGAGVRVGYELRDGLNPTPWQWCTLDCVDERWVRRIRAFRDCTQDEVEFIKDLLRHEAVLRYKPVMAKGELPWALVSLV